MYYLLLYGANCVRSVANPKDAARTRCLRSVCVCVCRRLLVVVDIYSPANVYRAPRGVSSGFLFISVFSTPNFLTERRIPSRTYIMNAYTHVEAHCTRCYNITLYYKGVNGTGKLAAEYNYTYTYVY